jgi:hypothetical protein
MTAAKLGRLAYIAFLVVVLVVASPFATPDMPWWSGLAIIGTMLAFIGATAIVESIRDDFRKTPPVTLRPRSHLRGTTRVLRRP